MEELTAATDTVELDLRGIVCPFVLAEIIRALDDHEDAALQVLCDHPHSLRVTVPTFCQTHGYDLEVEPVEGATFRMGISRPVSSRTSEREETS